MGNMALKQNAQKSPRSSFISQDMNSCLQGSALSQALEAALGMQIAALFRL